MNDPVLSELWFVEYLGAGKGPGAAREAGFALVRATSVERARAVAEKALQADERQGVRVLRVYPAVLGDESLLAAAAPPEPENIGGAPGDAQRAAAKAARK